ncbi:hypothetical protein AB2Z22_002053 [Clostridium botulinum]
MIINNNTSFHELLELWAKYSFSFFYDEKVTKEDLEGFKKINKHLENYGVHKIEIFNVNENVCTVRYFRNGLEFKKQVEV